MKAFGILLFSVLILVNFSYISAADSACRGLKDGNEARECLFYCLHYKV